jgi:hypothetical protein
MSDHNIISIAPRLAAKIETAARQRQSIDKSAQHFRVLSRAVRKMRDDGASTKEIVHTLRVIADELDGGSKPA